MQRVRDLSRKREQDAPEPRCRARLQKLALSSDILFLLSPHDRRIARMTGNDGVPVRRSMITSGDAFREPYLEFSSAAAFRLDLRFYKNLRRLEIVRSKRVHLSSLNDMHIDSLALDAVGAVCCDNAFGLSIFSLALRNMELPADDFVRIVAACRPSALTIENIACPGLSHSGLWRACEAVAAAPLLCLEVFDSFIDLAAFQNIVEAAGLRHFSFIQGRLSLAYRTRSPGLSICCAHNALLSMPPDSFRGIEALCIPDQGCMHFLGLKMPRLRYLKIEGAAIDAGHTRMLGPSIQAVVLAGCTFKNLAFYDFVRRLSAGLRFISFHQSEFPLDSFSFMKEKLSRCQVVVAGAISFYIDEKR